MGRSSSHVHLAIGLSLIGYRDLAIEPSLSTDRAIDDRAIGLSTIGRSTDRAIDDRAIGPSAIGRSGDRLIGRDRVIDGRGIDDRAIGDRRLRSCDNARRAFEIWSRRTSWSCSSAFCVPST
jgi:hypothetical protein